MTDFLCDCVKTLAMVVIGWIILLMIAVLMVLSIAGCGAILGLA